MRGATNDRSAPARTACNACAEKTGWGTLDRRIKGSCCDARLPDARWCEGPGLLSASPVVRGTCRQRKRAARRKSLRPSVHPAGVEPATFGSVGGFPANTSAPSEPYNSSILALPFTRRKRIQVKQTTTKNDTPRSTPVPKTRLSWQFWAGMHPRTASRPSGGGPTLLVSDCPGNPYFATTCALVLGEECRNSSAIGPSAGIQHPYKWKLSTPGLLM